MHDAGLVRPPRGLVGQRGWRHEFGHAVNEAQRAGIPRDVKGAAHVFGFGFEFGGGFHSAALSISSSVQTFSPISVPAGMN